MKYAIIKYLYVIKTWIFFIGEFHLTNKNKLHKDES